MLKRFPLLSPSKRVLGPNMPNPLKRQRRARRSGRTRRAAGKSNQRRLCLSSGVRSGCFAMARQQLNRSVVCRPNSNSGSEELGRFQSSNPAERSLRVAAGPVLGLRHLPYGPFALCRSSLNPPPFGQGRLLGQMILSAWFLSAQIFRHIRSKTDSRLIAVASSSFSHAEYDAPHVGKNATVGGKGVRGSCQNKCRNHHSGTCIKQRREPPPVGFIWVLLDRHTN